MSTITTDAEVLAEMLEKYTAYRTEAERRIGAGFVEEAFNAWFTLQVKGEKK